MQATRKEFIIALDEGTTNAKAVVLDSRGQVVVKFSQPLAIQTPREGWVEQSGEVLVDASLAVIAQAVAHIGAENVAALAISNQRETAIGWYRQSGKPINAAITWQCSRSAAFCDELRHSDKERQIKAVTGLPIAPLFSASKMRWLLESLPEARALAERGEICLGTIDSWLLWNLTQGEAFYCDYSNAARTQLLNLQTGQWDDNMLALFQIPRAALPEIKPSSGLFGYTRGLNAIPDDIPVMAMVGDSHAALGVYFVPALTGLGAPWWDDSARGVICGLSRGVKRAHLIRAALESITYQIADVVVAMRQQDDFHLTALMVDGGPTRNDWLMQYQADLLGCPVMRSDVAELSAIGAALLARKALNPGSVTDLNAFLTEHSEFIPDMARHQRLQKRWQEWRHAVNRTLWKPATSA
ncbi:MAG: FGGY family carbohydrate kinase [Klebsiella michiganensis]